LKNQLTDSYSQSSNGDPPPPMAVENKNNGGKQKRKRNRSDMEQRHDNDTDKYSKDKKQQNAPSSSSNNNNKDLYTKRVRTTIDDSATAATATAITSTALVEYSLSSITPPPKPPPALSIEALLSVPLSSILRQTNSTNNNNNTTTPSSSSTPSNQNFLLSRVEATILLKISQLAHEMDTLTSMTLQALDKSRIIRNLNDTIHHPTLTCFNRNDTTNINDTHTLYLRAIEPLLRMHGCTIPQQVLQHVQAETERILGDELPSLGRTLRQFSEQNWSVVNTLLDTMDNMMMMMMDGSGGCGWNVEKLAREKKAVAEFEEEVCRRIDRLVRMGSSCTSDSDSTSNVPLSFSPGIDNTEEEMGGGDAFDMAIDPQTRTFISMAEFCDNFLEDSVIEDNKAVVEYVAKSNTDLNSTNLIVGKKNGAEIPNICSSIGEGHTKIGDDAEENKMNDSDSRCNKNNGDHPGLKLTTDRPSSSEAKDSKCKSSDHNWPTQVQSHQDCNTDTSIRTNIHEPHVPEGDGDDVNNRCNETQAPLMNTTSDSLDDAATALGLLSSGANIG